MLKGLGIDLTHRCNLRCSFCWKFVEDSDYEMTMSQAENFCTYFGHLTPRRLRVTGGEPLCHPLFREIAELLVSTFTQSTIQVTTNGLLLEESLFFYGMQYIVTPYPENEDIGKRFPKAVIYPRPHGYFDRNHDPNLSEKVARRKHKNCVYKQIRIIGDNVYDCCHAQTMERRGLCGDVHSTVGEDWELGDWWEECVHCFVGDGGKKI